MAIDHPHPTAATARPTLPQVHAREAAQPALGAGPLCLPASACVVVLPDVALPGDGPGANLVALLAPWLARDGLDVLVHRPGAPEARGGAADVLRSLGIAAAHDAVDVADRWARREPAIVATGLLDPAAAARGSAWVLAAPRGPKHLLHAVPCAAIDPTPEAATVAARQTGAARPRPDGPWPSDTRRCPGLAVWIDGERRADLDAVAFDEPPGGGAAMPPGASAPAMAVFVQDVLSGARPMPAPLQLLALRVTLALRAIDGPVARGGVSCL